MTTSITDGRSALLGREGWWSYMGGAQQLERNASWDDITTKAPNLAMTVEKVPMSLLLDDDEPFTVADDEFAIVREDARIVRCGVGPQYTVVQTSEAYEWGSEVMEILGNHGEDAWPLAAVSLRGGRQYAFVFEQAEVEVNGVEYKGYFYLWGSHDGSTATSLRPVPVIAVCTNQFHMLRKAQAAFTFRHTSRVADRMDQALQILRMTRDAKDTFATTVRTLTTTRIEPREFDLLLDGMFPTEDVAATTLAQRQRAREAVRSLFSAPLNNGVENTGWAFVQAVNSYEQWNAPIRAAQGMGLQRTRAVRQFDAITRGSQPLTERATELVMAAR